MRSRLQLTPLAFLAAVSACSQDVNAPPGPAATLTSARAKNASLASQARSNAIKYKDSGITAAKVKDGAVEIEVRGVFGQDGGTQVEVTVGSFDTPVSGLIRRVSIEPSDGSLDALTFTNLESIGYWSTTITGFPPGTLLDVHVQVIPAGSKKPANLKGQITVARRPDLTVVSVNAPPRGVLGVPVLISAEVRELNADAGARGDCVLTVDGAAVDLAAGIWVDAGDAVNCLFTRTFAVGGAHSVQVSIANVSPGDWDPSNNAASASIVIDQPIPTGWLRVSESDWTETNVYGWDGFFPELHERNRRRRESSIDLSGFDVVPAPLPALKVQVTITKDGTPVHSTMLFAQNGRGVGSQGAPTEYSCSYYSAENQIAEACSGRQNGELFSQFRYQYLTGFVTYYGRDIACVLIFCTETTFSQNFVSGTGVPLGFVQGSAVGVSVTFEDMAGSRHFAAPVATIATDPISYDTGNQCHFDWDLLANWCSRSYGNGVHHHARVDW